MKAIKKFISYQHSYFYNMLLHFLIEPVVELSDNTDFVVAGMDKSTRAICFVRGQEFLGWFKSSGEQITGTNPSDRMFVEHEDDSYSLVINRLMLSDGGEYVCRGTKTSATYSLYVECMYCKLIQITSFKFLHVQNATSANGRIIKGNCEFKKSLG